MFSDMRNRGFHPASLKTVDDSYTSEVQITKLWLVYVPDQQDQVHRPFTATGDINEFAEATRGGTRLSPLDLSGVASLILQPSFQAGPKVKIANGFRQRRYAFFLELTTALYGTKQGSEAVEVITGYTSHDDEDAGIRASLYNSDKSLISPDLIFYVNNKMSFTRTISVGRITKSLITMESPKLLLHGHGTRDSGYHTLRPEDIIYAEENRMASFAPRRLPRFDTRGEVIATTPANAKYNSPSHYMSDLLKSFIKANSGETGNFYEEYDMRLSNTMSHLVASGGVGDGERNSIYHTTVCRNRPHNSASFSYGDIMREWGEGLVDSVSVVFNPTSQRSMINPLDTSEWHQSNEETMIAYEIAHTLPYILMRSLIYEITITITDRLVDGGLKILLTRPKEISEGYVTNNMMTQLEGEIHMAIVKGIIEPRVYGDYTVDMVFRLLTNSDINISLNGNAPIPFSAPMFCSSICSPQVSTDPEGIETLRDSILNITEFVTNEDNPYSQSYAKNPSELPSVRNRNSFQNETFSNDNKLNLGDLRERISKLV